MYLGELQDYPHREEKEQEQSQLPKRPRIQSHNGIIFCRVVL